jgi:hypothetical protein
VLAGVDASSRIVDDPNYRNGAPLTFTEIPSGLASGYEDLNAAPGSKFTPGAG